jgi:hypothetical protein
MKKEYLRDTKTDEIILTMYPMENDELISLIKGFVEYLGCSIRVHINAYGIDKTREEIENYIASLHYDIIDNPIPDLTTEEVEEGFRQNVSWVVEAWYENIGRERYRFF